MDLFKVEKSSGGGGELSKVPTTGGCLLLGVPTYIKPRTHFLYYKRKRFIKKNYLEEILI